MIYAQAEQNWVSPLYGPQLYSPEAVKFLCRPPEAHILDVGVLSMSTQTHGLFLVDGAGHSEASEAHPGH